MDNFQEQQKLTKFQEWQKQKTYSFPNSASFRLLHLLARSQRGWPGRRGVWLVSFLCFAWFLFASVWFGLIGRLGLWLVSFPCFALLVFSLVSFGLLGTHGFQFPFFSWVWFGLVWFGLVGRRGVWLVSFLFFAWIWHDFKPDGLVWLGQKTWILVGEFYVHLFMTVKQPQRVALVHVLRALPF